MGHALSLGMASASTSQAICVRCDLVRMANNMPSMRDVNQNEQSTSHCELAATLATP